MGIPSGQRHEICRAIHAEQNVVIQAALHGVSLEGSIIYATHTPCVLCAKILTNARIKRYVSFGKYNDDAFIQLFKEAGIELDTKDKPPLEIKYLD
jgi:dCMP deaminase